MRADVVPTVLVARHEPGARARTGPAPDAERTSPLQDPQVRQARRLCEPPTPDAGLARRGAQAAASGFIPPNHPALRRTDDVGVQPGGQPVGGPGHAGVAGPRRRWRAEAESVPGFADGEPLRLTLHSSPALHPGSTRCGGSGELWCRHRGRYSRWTRANSMQGSGASPLFGGWFELAPARLASHSARDLWRLA